MSEVSQPDQEPTVPVDFLDNLEKLLSKLVPPSSVTVTKCDGTEITLPGAIPARRQVEVFRLMRDLSEQPVVKQALAGAGTGAAASIVDAILLLAIDIEVAESLGKIFDVAYPGVLIDEDGNSPESIDVMPIEEIVVALVPFSERFIRRVGGGLSVLAASAMDLNE
tara:strand:+ start:25999 stop:26496 length:498 start_codon:yes stop_codon:yes gene_type:complete